MRPLGKRALERLDVIGGQRADKGVLRGVFAAAKDGGDGGHIVGGKLIVL
jgi:hypothetical protein